MLDKWRKKLRRSDSTKTAPSAAEDAALKERVIAVLRTIHDPEIPVNIYDLGLIYDISAADDGTVHVQMTLTTPNCPVAQSFPGWVESQIMNVAGVTHASVELVWDPPWNADNMSEAVRLRLGLY